MDSKNQYTFLRNLIKEYNTTIKDSDLANSKSIIEYDTFKRYTTSRKDHGPQTRLVYNVRKKWPILINKINDVPQKFGGTYLKTNKIEIGTNDKVGANIVLPDYWSKFGAPTTVEIAEALLEPEKEKVERYFNSDWGELQFAHFYPYRKPVIITPTLEEVAPSNVNNTLLQLFCPQYTTLDIRSKANKSAIEKITQKITPILDLKTFPSIVHIARSMITTRKKWLPVSVSHTPETAELSHFLCSKYHNIPVSTFRDVKSASMERLCGEIIRSCLVTPSPKLELIEALNRVTICERQLKEVLVDQEGDTPYISICRIALGLSINFSKRIRDTKFIIMESDMPRREVKAEWRLGLLVQEIKYMRFDGRYKVFFQWYNTKGYFVGEGRDIGEIYISSEKETYLLPLILDICYYCASIEPGFELNFGQYIKDSEIFTQFFVHHHSNLQPLYEHFNIGPSGTLSNSFHWKIQSNGYVQRILELTVPVQPYEQTYQEFVINDRLEVYLKHSMGLAKMLEPSEAVIPQNVPLPIGLDASKTHLIDIIKNPLVKIKTAIKRLAIDPDRCSELVQNAVLREDDPYSPMITQVVPVNNFGPANRKRLLETIKDPEWIESPRKRLKCAFDAMVSMSIQGRRRKASKVPLNNIPFKLVKENFSYEFDKGIVTDTQTTLRVMGETIEKKDFCNLRGYIQTGVYDLKPEVELVISVEEAVKRGLRKFCVQSMGRYFVVEHKVNMWNETDNIKESVKRQMELSKTYEMEEKMKRLAEVYNK